MEGIKDKSSLIREGESLDDLQNGYHIIQGKEAFRYGMDAVLLADFARVKKGERVLDMGTGTGIIPILLAARSQGEALVGLEIQEESADMAARSAAYNCLEERVRIVQGDIREADRIFGRASFDVVTSNPPYMIGSHGLVSEGPAKAIARHELLCTFEDLVRQSAAVLGDKGRFYCIHRPFRLAELLTTLVRHRLEPKRMRLVHPFVESEPNLVLIEARKNCNSRISVEAPLIVYRRPGQYTDEIRRIYGDGR